jgi:L-ascorbate metabolism protein UlaG (beta-lactamase superfamily)
MFVTDHRSFPARHGTRAMQITWYGHSAFRLDFAGKAVLIDP